MIDPEGVEAQLLSSLEFDGKRVLELGCGDGRVTWLYAHRAASVLALDPDEEAIGEARVANELAHVRFKVASAIELEVPPASFELALFSWSL